MMAEQFGEGSTVPVVPVRTPGWGLWCLWALASLAAAVAPWVFAGPLLVIGPKVDETPVVVVTAVLLLGSLVLGPGCALGALQFLVLRRYLAPARRWMPMTAVGFPLGWLLGYVVGFAVALIVGAEKLSLGGGGDFSEPGVLIILGVGGATAGGVLGALQFPVLRTHVARAGAWALVSAVAMSGGGLVLWTVGTWIDSTGAGLDGSTRGFAALLSSIIASFLVYGGISGYFLMSMLRQRGALVG